MCDSAGIRPIITVSWDGAPGALPSQMREHELLPGRYFRKNVPGLVTFELALELDQLAKEGRTCQAERTETTVSEGRQG